MALSVTLSVAQDRPVIEVGETVIAEMPSGPPAATTVTYELMSIGGGRVTIEVRSLDFNTGLRVWAGVDLSTAHLVAEDDDSGLGTDSQAVVKLFRKQRYVIEVHPVGDDWGGEFQLAVQRGATTAPSAEERVDQESAYWKEVDVRARQRENPGREIRALRARAEELKYDDPETARPLMDRAVALSEKRFGPGHLITATSLDGLASVHEWLGEVDVARSLLERALTILEEQLDPEDPRLVRGRRRLTELGTLRAGLGGITYPKLIPATHVQPKYPKRARKNAVAGRVVLEVIVRADGTIGNIQVLQVPANNLGFEEAAIEPVSRWRYEPAMKDGRPVNVYFTIIVEFVLR